MYKALHEYVTYWSTYNAIECYAFKGYFRCEASPVIKNNIHLTQTVMKNMLEAHVSIYQAIHNEYKQLIQNNPEIPKPMVGIQKNVIPMDPARHKAWWLLSPISGLTAALADKIQNKGFYDFFTTGIFSIMTNIPGKGSTNIKHENENAPQSLDWIGLNHYANMYLGPIGPVGEHNPDRITNNKNYRYYPEGLYRAIEQVSREIAIPLGKLKNPDGQPLPIIVAENGIAAISDEMRKQFFQETLFTIMHAIHDGYNVQGYLPWSSHDNYEWKTQKGTKRYGFFKVDFTDEQNPTIEGLKESSIYYATILKAFFNF